MEKITKEQFDKLNFSKYNNKSSKFTEALLKLKINEALLVKKNEWELKTTPIQRIGCDSHNKRSLISKAGIKLQGRTLADDGGWCILRTE